MEMLKDFNISSFKKFKPPSDNSITTLNEIKNLKKIPIRKKFVQEMDDVDANFRKIVGNDPIIKKLIAQSYKKIIELKKHYDRSRPAVLAKKLNIDLKDIKLKSMNTPSYPSGHSAQSTLLALVLSDKYPEKQDKLKKLARDTSYSRQVAHTHYLSDSNDGEKLGKLMYEHVKDKI
jgi:hypothetical protein